MFHTVNDAKRCPLWRLLHDSGSGYSRDQRSDCVQVVVAGRRAAFLSHAGVPASVSDLRGGPARGFAQILQWALECGKRPAARGSEERSGVRVYQLGVDATEAIVLGWHGRVGAGEAARAGLVLLAAVTDERAKIALAPEALSMLVSGVDPKQGTLRPCYER